MSKTSINQQRMQALFDIARKAERLDEHAYTELLIKSWESGPLNTCMDGRISQDICDLRNAETERDLAAESLNQAISKVRAKRATVESRINALLVNQMWWAAQRECADAATKVMKAKLKTTRAAGKIAELKKKGKR